MIEKLQKVGFTISLSERIDAHRILTQTDSIEELRLSLRMIFSKNKQQQQLFDILWDVGMIKPQNEFSEDMGANDPVSPLDTGVGEGLMGSNQFCATGIMPGAGGQAQGMASGLPGTDGFNDLVHFDSEFKGPVRQLLQGNFRNAAANMLRQITENSYTMEDLLQKKGQAMYQIENMLRSITPQNADVLIQQLEKEYLHLIQERIDLLDNINTKDPFSAKAIEDLPLMSLTPSPELTLSLKRLGKKLATKHKRRKRHGNQKINLRQTIRTNIQHGGTILELRRQRKRKEKPKLLLLTDISSSTLHATRLFLNIIWHAKEVFTDIRFYEFISTCLDVTNEFKKSKSLDEGLKSALNTWEKNTIGRENSDYYRALLTFERLSKEKLSTSSTVIILGDLRDWLGPWKNGKPVSASVMGRILKRVKRVIVLNPEYKLAWDTGDSICKYCSEEGIEIFETTNLNQLIHVILEIL